MVDHICDHRRTEVIRDDGDKYWIIMVVCKDCGCVIEKFKEEKEDMYGYNDQ